MCDLIFIENDSSPEASWRGTTAIACHTITPSIIGGSLQCDSSFTFSEVTHRRGQGLVTGIATEPYNGWTKQEGLMTHQPPSGNWLFTRTVGRWNGCLWHSWPTFDNGRVNIVEPSTLYLSQDIAEQFQTALRLYFHGISVESKWWNNTDLIHH